MVKNSLRNVNISTANKHSKRLLAVFVSAWQAHDSACVYALACSVLRSAQIGHAITITGYVRVKKAPTFFTRTYLVIVNKQVEIGTKLFT